MSRARTASGAAGRRRQQALQLRHGAASPLDRQRRDARERRDERRHRQAVLRSRLRVEPELFDQLPEERRGGSGELQLEDRVDVRGRQRGQHRHAGAAAEPDLAQDPGAKVGVERQPHDVAVAHERPGHPVIRHLADRAQPPRAQTPVKPASGPRAIDRRLGQVAQRLHRWSACAASRAPRPAASSVRERSSRRRRSGGCGTCRARRSRGGGRRRSRRCRSRDWSSGTRRRGRRRREDRRSDACAPTREFVRRLPSGRGT